MSKSTPFGVRAGPLSRAEGGSPTGGRLSAPTGSTRPRQMTRDIDSVSPGQEPGGRRDTGRGMPVGLCSRGVHPANGPSWAKSTRMGGVGVVPPPDNHPDCLSRPPIRAHPRPRRPGVQTSAGRKTARWSAGAAPQWSATSQRPKTARPGCSVTQGHGSRTQPVPSRGC